MADPKDVVRVEPPAALTGEEDISDEVVRKVLKTRFGHDDPEAFKTKIKRAEELEEAFPKYQQAITDLTGRLQELSRRPAEEPQRPSSQVLSPEEEDEKLAELFRLDPYKAYKIARQKERVAMAKMAAMAEERGASKARGETMRERYVERLRNEWPEAFDEKSELAKTATGIFWNEMSEDQRQSPEGFFAASERAAARIGLAPTSRRQKRAEPDRDRLEIASQSVGRGGDRPAPDSTDEIRLSAADKKRLSLMGIDEDKFKIAKAARRAGKNLIVEEGA